MYGIRWKSGCASARLRVKARVEIDGLSDLRTDLSNTNVLATISNEVRRLWLWRVALVNCYCACGAPDSPVRPFLSYMFSLLSSPVELSSEMAVASDSDVEDLVPIVALESLLAQLSVSQSERRSHPKTRLMTRVTVLGENFTSYRKF